MKVGREPGGILVIPLDPLREAYPVRFGTDAGVTIPLSNDTLIFFLDETGHEELADDKYPIFGLGGCGIIAAQYHKDLATPWRDLCEKFFDSKLDCLHDKPSTSLTTNQRGAVTRFFQMGNFFRCAAILDKRTTCPTDVEAFDAVMATLISIFGSLGLSRSVSKVTLIYEDTDRIRAILSQRFNTIRFGLKMNGRVVPVPHTLCFMPKTAAEPGLLIADQIISIAGKQVVGQIERGPSYYRKDFAHIFKDVPRHLADFRYITGVKRESADGQNSQS